MSRVEGALSSEQTWDLLDFGPGTIKLITTNAAAPEANRTAVNPAASASSPRNAIRHNIEFSANATSANVV
jgi:hypothetical protein